MAAVSPFFFTLKADRHDVTIVSLAEANDRGIPFRQIAAYIRENPENVFVDPGHETC